MSLVIPNTWTCSVNVPELIQTFQCLTFKIKVKETSLPDVRLEKIGWKIWVGPYATNNTQLILILGDPVDDEEDRPRTDPQLLTMRSKETEELFTHLDRIDHHFLLYFTLAWQSNFLQIFLMWSQITFLLSIRRTGSQQIDFKVLSLWW
jgi:hypothetical protein